MKQVAFAYSHFCTWR